MTKNHLKMQMVPKTWPIERKKYNFVTRPKPGAHKKELSIPLNILLRDVLEKARTKKEVKKILKDYEVLVNGKRRYEDKFSVGLLDVFAIPKENEQYVMLINEHNTLFFKPLDKKDSESKISKISDKKLIGKGKIQITTFDGRTILASKDEYKTGDSVLLSIPKQEIKEVFRLESGAPIFLFKGRHVGKFASIVEIKGKLLRFKSGSDEYETNKDYAIVIGNKDKLAINTK